MDKDVSPANQQPSLIAIRKNDIPLYLREGDFYKSLNDDDLEESIFVPPDTLKPTLELYTHEDLTYLLTSLRYWMVLKPHIETLEYVLCSDTVNDVIDPFETSLTYLSGFRAIREALGGHSDKCVLDIALYFQLLDAAKLLHQRGDVVTENSCECAAFGGDLECLQYAVEIGGAITEGTYRTAISKGHVPCLRYMHGLTGSKFRSDRNCMLAACAGRLDSLLFLIDVGESCTSAAANGAAGGGHLHILRYMLGLPNAHDLFADASCMAAVAGHVHCVQFLHDHVQPWDAATCAAAAKGGHLHCLQYLHERGCPWDSRTCTNAVRADHLECLKYAAEQGCTVPSSLIRWVKPAITSQALQEYTFRLCYGALR